MYRSAVILGLSCLLCLPSAVRAGCIDGMSGEDLYAYIDGNSDAVYCGIWRYDGGQCDSPPAPGGRPDCGYNPNGNGGWTEVENYNIDPTDKRYRYRTCYFNTPECPPPPPSTEPPECTDGYQSGDEIGIDCGGSCSAPCISNCKPGTTLWNGGPDIESDRCVQEVLPDNYGNCPNLTDWTYYPASELTGEPAYCSKVTKPFLHKDEVEQPPADDPWATAPTSSETTETTETTTNPDGSTTTTTTETTTNPDGSTTTTTSTNTAGGSSQNDTDEALARSVTAIKDGLGKLDGTAQGIRAGIVDTNTTLDQVNDTLNDLADDPGNIPTIPTPEYDPLFDNPEASDFDDLYNIANNSPVGSIISSSRITASGGTCSASVPLFGKSIKISICEWESTFAGMGYLVVAFATLYGFFIIIGRDS